MRIRNRVSITVLTAAVLVLPLAGIRAASAAPSMTTLADITALTDSAERGLADRTLAGSGSAAYAYYRDGTGRLIVETAPANTSLTRTLHDDYGPAVTVVPHAVSRAIRTADDAPHYGGARLHLKNYSAGCSSGVTLVRAGVRHMITAGHCYSTGTNVYSGQFYFGLVNIRRFPNPDLELINGNPGTSGQGAQNYDSYVYTDPATPGTAAVSTRWNTPVGGYVCTDGSYSQEHCGARVATTTASFCDTDGCTYNLARAQQAGKLVAQLGDSGGPVYQKPTAKTVAFQGIIVATSLNLSSTSGDTVWFHTLATIESSLGGQVLTGPYLAADPAAKH